MKKATGQSLPDAMQVAAYATSLDKIKIIPRQDELYIAKKIRVWFPGQKKRIAKVCANHLNSDIDIAVDEYEAKTILIGTLVRIVKRNNFYADVEMEYKFEF